MHDELEVHLDKVPDHEVDPGRHLGDGRMLASDLGGLRILVDYSKVSVSATELAYMKKVMTAAVNYWFKTLQVPQMSVLKIPESQVSMCGGLTIPSVYRTTGVAADMVFFVTTENSFTNFLAWSRACKLLSSNGRPVVGQINFNMHSMKGGSDADFQSDLMVVLHEMTHSLGFSNTLYDNFAKPAKVATTTLGGRTYSYLNVEPLTSKLKAYFGCSSIPGAILEDQGGSGSAGSHWERRIFSNEYMTASQINDQRISELTLALLDGTGWYEVNYAMADPFYFGKGEGCGFLSKCSGYKEYCSASGDACTFHGAAGGYCNSDSFSDGCNFVRAYSNHDCTNAGNAGGATLGAEYYGYGSKCFTGTLYSGGALSSTKTYCFSYTCTQQSSGAYQLNVHVGSSSGVCTQKGQIKISGYNGYLNCPDPQVYCSTVGRPACRRGCMGKGTCSGGVCSCYAGWGGVDCSKKVAAGIVGGNEELQEVNYEEFPDGYVPNDDDAPEFFGEGPNAHEDV
jgi:hypothetical protein